MVFSNNNTATDNLIHTFLYEYDVTGLNVVSKLPSSVRSILVRVFVTVGFLHLFLHSIFAIESRKISDTTPTDTHYTCLVELIPLASIVTGRVYPIPCGIDVIIRKRRSIALFRFNPFKHIFTERQLKAVFVSELLTAFSHAVGFVTRLTIIVNNIVTSRRKRIKHLILAIILSNVADQANSNFNIGATRILSTFNHISKQSERHLMGSRAKRRHFCAQFCQGFFFGNGLIIIFFANIIDNFFGIKFITDTICNAAVLRIKEFFHHYEFLEISSSTLLVSIGFGVIFKEVTYAFFCRIHRLIGNEYFPKAGDYCVVPNEICIRQMCIQGAFRPIGMLLNQILFVFCANFSYFVMCIHS